MEYFLDIFSFYYSQVRNMTRKLEGWTKGIPENWIKVREQSIMLKQIPNNICIGKLSFENTYKNRIFPKMYHPVKNTKFASYHQREIMFSILIWNTVHGLFRQENSRVTTRWQNVMNIQLILLLKCIILYLAQRIGYFCEAEAQAITVPFTEN